MQRPKNDSITKALKSILITVFLIAFAVGCSTTSHKENMLTAAGFKMVPADSPAKQAHLKTLTPDRITPVERDGTMYYTFPDAKHNELYVGRQSEYEEYQRLRLENQMVKEQLETAQMNEDAWGAWGPWGW